MITSYPRRALGYDEDEAGFRSHCGRDCRLLQEIAGADWVYRTFYRNLFLAVGSSRCLAQRNCHLAIFDSTGVLKDTFIYRFITSDTR